MTGLRKSCKFRPTYVEPSFGDLILVLLQNRGQETLVNALVRQDHESQKSNIAKLHDINNFVIGKVVLWLIECFVWISGEIYLVIYISRVLHFNTNKKVFK